MGPKKPGGSSSKKPDSKSHSNRKKTSQQPPRKRELSSPPPLRRHKDAAAVAAGQKDEIDLSKHAIPITLQQLLLNVFKYGLLDSQPHSQSQHHHPYSSSTEGEKQNNDDENENENENENDDDTAFDLQSGIQTLKSHLYNRDFAAAFTDADADLLRAYALRWSASRALGYAGLFEAVLVDGILSRVNACGHCGEGNEEDDDEEEKEEDLHVLCVGGGAGAEIVALAGAWRNILDHQDQDQDQESKNVEEEDMTDGIKGLSLNHPASGLENDDGTTPTQNAPVTRHTRHTQEPLPNLSVTAVDIADWSSVVARLSDTIHSSAVLGSKAHPAPLLPPPSPSVRSSSSSSSSSSTQNDSQKGSFRISFHHLDILNLPDTKLQSLLQEENQHSASAHFPRRNNSKSTSKSKSKSKTVLITLMFTLNELFSTSMAKTTQFLLRLSDMTQPGTILLVVDSPGSYSTLSLGKDDSTNDTTTTTTNGSDRGGGNGGGKSEGRYYPMKFLLDHTLLSVAEGRWERIVSQDSRWWRREASKLKYDVAGGGGGSGNNNGPGLGSIRLEDMRFQIHVYRRLS